MKTFKPWRDWAGNAEPPPDRNSWRLTSLSSSRPLKPANNVGPVARQDGVHDKLELIDQSQIRQGQRELHASHEQDFACLPLELLNGFP
jgi:hypothetical protein